MKSRIDDTPAGLDLQSPVRGTPSPPGRFPLVTMRQPVIARTRRPSPVLICKKCLKRCHAGHRIRDRLKHQLKEGRYGKKTSRLVSVNCFGICPKRAVVLASGHSLAKDEYVLVSRRRQVGTALERLLPTGVLD